jgi:hypothetical protein
VTIINPSSIIQPPRFDIASRTNYKFLGLNAAKQGSVLFSGDSTTKAFTIAHDLGNSPRTVILSAMSADAAGPFYWTADATNITVNFKTAPPTGVNNIVLAWQAEV